MKSVSQVLGTWRRGVSFAFREGVTAGEVDGWLPGYNPAVVTRVRLLLTVVWILANFSLLQQMLHDPDLDPDMARLSVGLMNGLLVLDGAIWAAFLGKWHRGYSLAAGASALCIFAVLLIWVQMTGSVSSYYIGALFMGILGLRVVAPYRLALGCTLLAAIAHGLIYALETRGVLAYAPLVRSEMSVPAGFRAMAASSILMSYPFAFVTANFLAKFVRRQKAALDQARSDLRRAADAARIGRLSGTRLGDYGIEELLGRGGMGEVYAARRLKDGKPVAIKLLHAHLGSDEKARMRFRREAEVVGKMPTGTVAAVHQFGTTEDGYDYIVMERLLGQDLATLLRRRERLEPDELLAIVKRVAAGIDAAHAVGVVHRDLKPHNVFLCDRDTSAGQAPDVRLLDFGVARLRESAAAGGMTATAAVLGTPGYMPPEQASGGEVGPAADTFALGAIVYRALTGKPAFPSRSPAGALFEAIHLEPLPPSERLGGLSRDVDAVLGVALAKDPEERYQCASELVSDLELALRGELPESVKQRATSIRRSPDSANVTMTAG